MRRLTVLLLAVMAVSAYPRKNRIFGGTVTSIDQYPEMASLLLNRFQFFAQECGGVIINNRSILTAAHCTNRTSPSVWRARLGSTLANRGGIVFNAALIINHSQYGQGSMFNNDIAIIRVQTAINFSPVIKNALFPYPSYNVPDGEALWTAGWGYTSYLPGSASGQLQHVQLYSINQEFCRERYRSLLGGITDNMMCAGVFDGSSRGQCAGDSGGPLYHNGVVVGIASFGPPGICGDPTWPDVNTRVERYIGWIIQNY